LILMVENLEVYETVKRWVTKLEAKSHSVDFTKSSTKRAALYWLKKYLTYVKTNPDGLIRERIDQVNSTSLMERRKHEEYFEGFIVQLKRDGYSPNSIATATGLIRSFYKANHYPLVEVSTVRPYKVRAFKVPTVKDLKKMCDTADLPIRAWMLGQAESGLANADLLSLTPNTLSSEFGTIKTQLRKGTVPIHIEIRRQKTGERTDSFFGSNAVEALNEYINNSHGRLFKLSARTVEQQVKSVGIEAKVATKDVPITPYSLRKFFNTYMKLAGVNESLVELMMGHSIGRVRGAYLVTGKDSMATGIPISELAKIYMEAYPTIDIKLA
jgi:integrase